MQWVFTLISHKVWNVVLVLLMCSGSSGSNSSSQHRLAICLISSGALQSNFDLRIYRQLMEGEPRVCHNCWSGIIICLINHQRCQRHRGPESWVLSPTVLPPTHQKSCCQVISSAHKQCQHYVNKLSYGILNSQSLIKQVSTKKVTLNLQRPDHGATCIRSKFDSEFCTYTVFGMQKFWATSNNNNNKQTSSFWPLLAHLRTPCWSLSSRWLFVFFLCED